jgi:hypothetical protein
MTDYPQPEPHPVDASASVNVGLAAAKSEADGIIRDKASPYWDSGHYQHRETVDRVTNLMAQVHGDRPAYEDGVAGSETSDFSDQFDELLAPPPDPGAYDFSDIRLDEGEEWDPGAEEQVRGWFQQLGISETEGRVFTQRFDEFRRLDVDSLDRIRHGSEVSLEKHWGADYEANMRSARAVVAAVGPDFREFLNRSGMGNDHAMCLTLNRIAKANGL